LRAAAGACDSGPVRRPFFVLILGLLAALVVSGCGGQSDSEKAQAKVCDARADISKQVDELKGLTLATATVSGVRENVTAIQDDLKQMAGAQDTLSEDRRKEVKTATDTFVASAPDRGGAGPRRRLLRLDRQDRLLRRDAPPQRSRRRRLPTRVAITVTR
jgi:hypothetical protein